MSFDSSSLFSTDSKDDNSIDSGLPILQPKKTWNQMNYRERLIHQTRKWLESKDSPKKQLFREMKKQQIIENNKTTNN